MTTSNAAPLKMSDAAAKRLLERVAAEPDALLFTAHASAQMRQRGIDALTVRECLRRGKITESPVIDYYGRWQLRIERYVSGENIGCAVALDWHGPTAIVITAFRVK